MAQHDYVIANGTGAAVRSDLNAGFAAIVSQNSGATAPSTTYAYQSWADTSAGVMKMRNGANNAWISLYELDGTFLAGDISLSAGAAATPSLFFTGDTNTGIYSPGADQVAISTGGTARITIDGSGNVNIDSNTVCVDAANNRVGIVTSSPLFPLDVNGTIYTRGRGSTFGVLFDDWRIYNSTAPGALVFDNGTEKARIDSSGRLLVGGSPDSGGALLQVFGDRIRVGTAKTPASASDTGTAGEICWDASYIYVCTATNTWKRTAIATW